MLPRLAQPARRSLAMVVTSGRASAIAQTRPRSAAIPACSISRRFNSRPYSTPPSDPEQPTGLDEGERAIFAKLRAAFPGKQLEVQDVSGGCGSFYSILISSPKFAGLSTIKQHKLVNACLKEDIQGIHGLQLKTIPEE